MMARGGVTTAMDHHYVFPQGSGDLSGAIIRAAREMGVRFTLARGSMDRSEKDGGLPPDFAVETLEGALAATEATVDEHHDPSFGAMTQVAVAPCSPFSVSTELMRQGAELARRKGVRLHTHGSETVEEEQFCKELFGMGPTEYFESTGWLGEDVWMAHCVHMNDSDIAAFARTKTGVAHCPSSNARLAAYIARVPDMLAAGCPGRPRRRRHRLERVRRTPHRTAQRPPHQPPRRPPGSCPERSSGAAPGHLRRRPGPGQGGGDRFPGAGQARRPRAVEAGHPRARLDRRPGDRAGLRRGGPGHALARGRRTGGGERPSCCTSTRTSSPATRGRRRSASRGSPPGPDPLKRTPAEGDGPRPVAVDPSGVHGGRLRGVHGRARPGTVSFTPFRGVPSHGPARPRTTS